MEYIISQILGGIVFVFVFLSMQTKNITIVMICQIGCNVFGMASYVLLDGFSGAAIYMVATLQSIIYFYIRKYDKKEPRWLRFAIISAYIICSAVAIRGALDIIPMVAAVLCALGISQKKPTNYRIIMLLNGVSWSVYDVFIGASMMLASHIFTFCAALIGIIRLDIMRRKEK